MTLRPKTDADFLDSLASDDAEVVVAALHAACPCGGSSERYEAFLDVVRGFEKDPRPAVRKAAMHLQYDAFEELTKDDERAAGFVRNRAGGNEHRNQTRHGQRRR